MLKLDIITCKGGFIKMKKSALVLFGSPHKDGYSSKLLNSFLLGLKNHDINIINSYEYNIKPCIDCKFCQENNSCFFDDFSKIDKLIRNSSLLIIATPVYNLSFPSPLKAIFDRMQLYYSYKISNKKPIPENLPKKCVLLLTCGKNKLPSIDIITQQLKLILLTIDSKLDYNIVIENTDTSHNYNHKLKDAYKLAKKFV